MSRRRWGVRAVAASVLLVLLPLVAPTTASTAPNPFGDRSTATTIVLHRDGSYDVILRQTQQLVLAYDLTFGGGVHDGFRLADALSTLPPYLRATYAFTSFTVPAGGPAAPTEFTRANHLLSASNRGPYPVGTHTAEIRYRVTGAAEPTERGWSVYVRLLDIGYGRGERVEIDASEVAPTGLVLRCVTFAPDTEACGTVGGSTLIDVFDADLDQTLPPEYRIDVTADSSAVPPPIVDTR